MSKNSVVLPTTGTVSGLLMTQKTNDALDTLVTLNSGASEPSPTKAYMLWADTGNMLLKQRNADNDDWIILGTLDAANLGLLSLAGGNLTGALNEAYATVASHATTAPIWAALGNLINYTGTEVATAFPNAPQAGAKRTLICAAACGFTAGANMLINGIASASTYTAAAGDRVEVEALSTTQFKLTITKYDGTALTGSTPASQSEMEAATNDTKTVTPVKVKYSPSAAKAWVNFNGTGTVAINASYNVSSITDNNTGDYTVNFTIAFSSIYYGFKISTSPIYGSAPAISMGCVQCSDTSEVAPTVSAFRFDVTNTGGSGVDTKYISLVFYGDQ